MDIQSAPEPITGTPYSPDATLGAMLAVPAAERSSSCSLLIGALQDQRVRDGLRDAMGCGGRPWPKLRRGSSWGDASGQGARIGLDSRMSPTCLICMTGTWAHGPRLPPQLAGTKGAMTLSSAHPGISLVNHVPGCQWGPGSNTTH